MLNQPNAIITAKAGATGIVAGRFVEFKASEYAFVLASKTSTSQLGVTIAGAKPDNVSEQYVSADFGRVKFTAIAEAGTYQIGLPVYIADNGKIKASQTASSEIEVGIVAQANTVLASEGEIAIITK